MLETGLGAVEGGVPRYVVTGPQGVLWTQNWGLFYRAITVFVIESLRRDLWSHSDLVFYITNMYKFIKFRLLKEALNLKTVYRNTK